jgi:uncharacterized protein YecE (DUF72 family)
MGAIFVGTAGWAIRSEHGALYDSGISHLARYATRFSAVEINSSFYRPHRPATYARWALSVPEHFRFAVKAPRSITHEKKLKACEDAWTAFAAEIAGLGEKLGVVLVQLPPKLGFDPPTAQAFFAMVRQHFEGFIACEPRHASWFTLEADALLIAHRIGRVAADPAFIPESGKCGGWPGLAYWRLHGSPRMYYSAYAPERLTNYARDMRQAADAGAQAWCIFDNTALGAGAFDAATTLELLRASPI